MATLKSVIDSCSAAFAASLLAGLQDLPLSELTNLGGAAAAKKVTTVVIDHAVKAPKAAKAKTTSTGRLARRDPASLQLVIDNIVALLATGGDEGFSSEQLQTALGIDKKELTRPVVLALEQGVIRKEGEKRGTRYFTSTTTAKPKAAKKAAKPKAAKKAAKPAKKAAAKAKPAKAARKSKRAKTLVVGSLPKEDAKSAEAAE